MRCHKCYHDSLFIKFEDNSRCHIKCSNCEIDIEVEKELTLTPTEELILYNISLSEAFAEGKKDFIEGKEISANPYNGSPHSLDSSIWWVKGWTEEKEEMSRVSSFLSAKKEIEEELEVVIKNNKEIGDRIDKNEERYSSIFCLCTLIVELLNGLRRKNYWFGSSYKKDIKDILLKITEFCENSDLGL